MYRGLEAEHASECPEARVRVAVLNPLIVNDGYMYEYFMDLL